jgi:hypothetical protein
MKSLAEIAAHTNAFKPARYIPVYERIFEPVRLMPLAILELGVFDGGSLEAWEAYFPNAEIAGVDLKQPALNVSNRVRQFEGDQTDTGLLSRVASEVAPNGFDIIIDDCAHIGAVAKTSFWHLFDNHLKEGGIYSIEDWGTGYWPTWADGREVVVEADALRRMPSHDAGMVGFIKQLIDELGADDIKEGYTSPPIRRSKISEISLYLGLCVVRKAPAGGW